MTIGKLNLAQWSHMTAAMRKEQEKGTMSPETMDSLLEDARKQYDWIK